jgi:huntingtin
VSWDDVQRGTVGGGLSCWGSNITDTRLYAKDARPLFTVRGDNWNERLGKVSTSDIALVANDSGGGGGVDSLKPFTLREFLSRPSSFGSYNNLTASSLADADLDKTVSVRFQTTFLPVDASTSRGTLQFAPEAYNYNTRSDDDPRNLVLLCTSQGLAVQQDGSGAKKLFHHAVDPDGRTKRYWLEAEASDHKVGGEQRETKEEREDALARGKATSSVIGLQSMGTRFNTLMTIQIPLQQKPQENMPPAPCSAAFGGFGGGGFAGGGFGGGIPTFSMCAAPALGAAYAPGPQGGNFGGPKVKSKARGRGAPRRMVAAAPTGKSSAARVSRGSAVDETVPYEGLKVKDAKRHENEGITVTIVFYYVCAGGVPSESDVVSAINDLENMYRGVENSNLGDEKFDFMKSELTVNDANQIAAKITEQPPKPTAVSGWNFFPR